MLSVTRALALFPGIALEQFFAVRTPTNEKPFHYACGSTNRIITAPDRAQKHEAKNV